jgi:hypothetical protein
MFHQLYSPFPPFGYYNPYFYSPYYPYGGYQYQKQPTTNSSGKYQKQLTTNSSGSLSGPPIFVPLNLGRWLTYLM